MYIYVYIYIYTCMFLHVYIPARARAHTHTHKRRRERPHQVWREMRCKRHWQSWGKTRRRDTCPSPPAPGYSAHPPRTWATASCALTLCVVEAWKQDSISHPKTHQMCCSHDNNTSQDDKRTSHGKKKPSWPCRTMSKVPAWYARG